MLMQRQEQERKKQMGCCCDSEEKIEIRRRRRERIERGGASSPLWIDQSRVTAKNESPFVAGFKFWLATFKKASVERSKKREREQRKLKGELTQEEKLEDEEYESSPLVLAEAELKELEKKRAAALALRLGGGYDYDSQREDGEGEGGAAGDFASQTPKQTVSSSSSPSASPGVVEVREVQQQRELRQLEEATPEERKEAVAKVRKLLLEHLYPECMKGDVDDLSVASLCNKVLKMSTRLDILLVDMDLTEEGKEIRKKIEKLCEKKARNFNERVEEVKEETNWIGQEEEMEEADRRAEFEKRNQEQEQEEEELQEGGGTGKQHPLEGEGK